ncbi:MAG: recombinase family protein [Candidatus Falkowbacteria bacterium]
MGQTQALMKTRTQTETELPVSYCLYARKSSEDDERQALSIDSQIKEMLAASQRDGLNIKEVRQESHSAKESGQRPVFMSLLEDVRRGKFSGILTWAPDRLSRNAGDLGSIVDLMDQGRLREIRTNGQKFTNSPNEKFLLMILCSQAKLENDNKGVNVRRGLRAKCDMGIRPGHCPLGYFNEMSTQKGKNRILVDEERAPIVKQIFDRVANDFWTGREVYRWLKDDLDFRTRGDKHVTLGGVYRILESTFYYGEFEFPKGSGNLYQGTHTPLISKELFERVRNNLIAAPKQFGLKEFQFTKILSCGLCGGGITATEKIKRNLQGGVKRYVYYHCSNKARVNCHQAYIREEELLQQFVGLMDRIDFNRTGIYGRLKEEVNKYNKFSKILSGSGMPGANKIKQDAIDVPAFAKYILSEGTIQEKRDLLLNLKTKLILKDKRIVIK